MATLTQQDLDLLRRFGALPEGRLLVSVLQSRLTDYDQRNRRAIGEDLYRTQGRALEIEDLLEILDPLNLATALPRKAPEPKRPPRLPIVNHMAD
jgi:hypothetical protein